jgi:hypothetical protein
MKKWIHCLLVVWVCAGVSAQTHKTLEETLAELREPLVLSGGKLTGQGAGDIRSSLGTAQFVLIGEDHGLAEIPAFSTALFDELVPLGYKNLVIEVGPMAGRELNRIVHQPDPDVAIQAYEERYPFSLAFYNMREEFDFLKHARNAAGPKFHVVGIDQELMGASKLLLETVLSKHLHDEASAPLHLLMEHEQTAYAEAGKTGNPMQLYMMTADRREIERVRDQLLKMNDAESAGLLSSLLESRDVYQRLSSSQLASNTTRALLMKRNWITERAVDAHGVPEKAVFKFGANHIMKGLNIVNSREIGNYVAEIADGLNRPSVHILIVATKGNQVRFTGIGKPMQPAPVDLLGPGQSDFPFAKPLFQRALQQSSEWSVFFAACANMPIEITTWILAS